MVRSTSLEISAVWWMPRPFVAGRSAAGRRCFSRSWARVSLSFSTSVAASAMSVTSLLDGTSNATPDLSRAQEVFWRDNLLCRWAEREALCATPVAGRVPLSEGAHGRQQGARGRRSAGEGLRDTRTDRATDRHLPRGHRRRCLPDPAALGTALGGGRRPRARAQGRARLRRDAAADGRRPARLRPPHRRDVPPRAPADPGREVPAAADRTGDRLRARFGVARARRHGGGRGAGGRLRAAVTGDRRLAHQGLADLAGRHDRGQRLVGRGRARQQSGLARRRRPAAGRVRAVSERRSRLDRRGRRGARLADQRPGVAGEHGRPARRDARTRPCRAARFDDPRDSGAARGHRGRDDRGHRQCHRGLLEGGRMRVRETAELMLAAAAGATDREPLTDSWPELDIETAYAIQDEALHIRQERGETLIGLKLGLTSRAKQQRMGIDSPLLAWLTDAMVLPAGTPVPRGELIHPRAEPELVFVLGQRLSGPGVTAATALAAVDRVYGGIEIIDSRFADYRFKLPDAVADNGSSAYFGLGPVGVRPERLDLSLEAALLEVDGQMVVTATGC